MLLSIVKLTRIICRQLCEGTNKRQSNTKEGIFWQNYWELLHL